MSEMASNCLSEIVPAMLEFELTREKDSKTSLISIDSPRLAVAAVQDLKPLKIILDIVCRSS